MSRPIPLRDDYSAADLRQLACGTRDAKQARRLLAIAAVLDGKGREEAAMIGGGKRHALQRWIRDFNASGPSGLADDPRPGRPPKLSDTQLQELVEIVKTGPDPETDHIVRWRCVDLRDIIQERFGVELSRSSVARILSEMGFSHISARPQNPRQDPEQIDDFKKNYPARFSE